MAEHEPYPHDICVHGNGFIQVPWQGRPGVRVHIWHPELAAQRQTVSTTIHDHRWNFRSLVLYGHLVNRRYVVSPSEHGAYDVYRADGPRLPNGNRYLARVGSVSVTQKGPDYYRAGSTYSMRAGEFHETLPSRPGDLLVTAMTKVAIVRRTCRVLCRRDEEPDQDFSRYQVPWSEVESCIRDAQRHVQLFWGTWCPV